MTPDEAAKRWCPFSQQLSDGSLGPGSYNRSGNRIPEQCRCLGPDCMAWRWEISAAGIRSDRSGYCGLAGTD